VDLKEAAGVWEVFIVYKGACAGCPSAGTNTLSAIETILKQKLGKNIKVVPS
jgi:NifU-like protein